ncbi:MAG TPA: hypothetical protein VKA67_09820, partial [Verrucomicrobiae bacterium]|nr:hypothetical protein [Verrucomicrobiae bacterium]
QAVPEGVEYQAGLGNCFVLTSANLSSYDPETLRYLREKASAAARYWQMLPNDNNSANAAIPVVGNLKVPVRGMVFIMLAFVIVIGPVNIIVLNRRKRRTWLLWTIPAISLFTTLLVFAYSLLSEGITPDARIVGLTILDQAGHHATTVGATAFYCPLTPSDGLTFDSDTEVTPLLRVRSGSSGSSRDVDWTQTQHLVNGWVPARVPAYFHVRKSESRRERLQLENDNDRLEIVNGLGAPIKLLWLADASGEIYEAQNVGAGQKAGLTPSGHSQVSDQLGADKLFHDLGFAVNLTSLQTGGEKYLRPGTYIAELDGSPFIENALGSAASPRRTKSRAVVFGILDSSRAK